MKSSLKLPLLSGVLLGVGYFPGPFLPLNLVGFVPLLFWLDARPHATTWARLVAGLTFGLTTHLISMHFMYSMLEQSWLAALLYVGFAGALAVRISLSVALMGWLRRRTGLSFGLLLPLTWLPFEWVQTWGDLRMTGEHLAHSVAEHVFVIQFADITGPYGVGAFVLGVNGLLFELVRYRSGVAGRRAGVALAILLAVVGGYDAWRWTRPEPDAPRLRVALIQPNVPLAVKHDASTAVDQWSTLLRLTLEAAELDPDLIVWPESARPVPLVHDLDRPQTYRMVEIQSLAERTGIAFVVGAEYLRHASGERDAIYNGAFAIDRTGRLLEPWAAKRYLVPFVEATPFRSVLGPLVEGRGGQWEWLAGGFEPGPRNALLPVADARVGVLVCYEQLFAELARGLSNAGAELQLIITNDAWFGRSLFQGYQAHAVQLRAIETRTSFVRVANTGISGFVDSRGRYHRRTRLFEEAVEVWDVPLSTRRTVYARTGDLVAWIAIAGLASAIAVARYGTPWDPRNGPGGASNQDRRHP